MRNRKDKLFGGIEAGGTKFLCAAGSGPDNLEVIRFATTTPDETISRAIACLKDLASGNQLSAIGIGSFGPVDLERSSLTYGYITSTPKPHWHNTNLLGAIRREFDIPIGFQTDTNTAALGEYYWGAGRGLSDFIYLTIGTGIGGGGMMNGMLMGGLVHPEMGHIVLPRHPKDRYKGRCPFHHNRCFEGLATGPAVEERWGRPPEELGTDHEAWALQAHYISLALVSFICTLSPRRIILGGGVMKQRQLFPMIRAEVKKLLNHYVRSPAIEENIDSYIVPPGLGDRAGILGAIALAIGEIDAGKD